MLINSLKTYTYKDYLTYDENERIEIIEGKIINMNPASNRIHQEIISEIHFRLKEHIKSNNLSCKVYPAPFDVILINDDEEITNSKNIHI